MCVLHSSNDYYNSEAYRILHQGEFTLRLYDSILKRSNCNVYNE